MTRSDCAPPARASDSRWVFWTISSPTMFITASSFPMSTRTVRDTERSESSSSGISCAAGASGAAVSASLRIETTDASGTFS